jgi:hypothetical protein
VTLDLAISVQEIGLLFVLFELHRYLAKQTGCQISVVSFLDTAIFLNRSWPDTILDFSFKPLEGHDRLSYTLIKYGSSYSTCTPITFNLDITFQKASLCI